MLTALLVVAAAAAALGWLVAGPDATPRPALPFWGGPAPRVIAHRGGAGRWPENTLLAFRQSAALGADVLEMDLRRTADGAIVVLHDATVDRTTDGHGAVDRLTLAELRRLDAGHRWSADGGGSFPFRGQGLSVPTLREVLEALPGARLNLEIKEPGPAMAAPLCTLLRAHGAARRVAVVAAEQAAIDAFRAACPEVATAASAREVLGFVLRSALAAGRRAAPRYDALQVPERFGPIPVLTPRLVRDAHALNLRVEAWTVDDPDAMRRLLALPVDGIMTTLPERLLPLVAPLRR